MRAPSPTTEIIRTAARRNLMNDAEIARRSGLARSTLSDYFQKRPGQMPLFVLSEIADATGMTDAEIVAVVRGGK